MNGRKLTVDAELEKLQRTALNSYGFKASFNPSGSTVAFRAESGPIVLMIENHRSGLLWQLTRKCGYIVNGLRRARFGGGWL